jgi:hypothetical protein
MVIPLLLQRGLNLGGEFASLGHGDNLLSKPQFVPAFSIDAAIPVPPAAPGAFEIGVNDLYLRKCLETKVDIFKA